MENALCPLCRDEVENAQHLLCTCKVTQRVWDLCERWIRSVTTRHGINVLILRRVFRPSKMFGIFGVKIPDPS